MNFSILSIFLVLIYFENVSKALIILEMKPLVVLKRANGLSKYPVVPTARQCGGSAEFHEVRCENCKVANNVATVKSLQQIQIEIDFTPERDARGLILKIQISIDDDTPVTVHNDPILNSIVTKGTKYTITTTTIFDIEVKGMKAKARFVISDKIDKSHRLCSEVEVAIHPEPYEI